MEEKYDVIFSLAAEEDLDQIYRYISEKLFATQAADALMDRIEKHILRLRTFPYSCPFVSGTLLTKKKYYKLIIDDYIVFFTVKETEKKVEIARVIYGLRAYKDLL